PRTQVRLHNKLACKPPSRRAHGGQLSNHFTRVGFSHNPKFSAEYLCIGAHVAAAEAAPAL
ncbi:MAG TPA: hypothetical protein VED85_05615, partial [Burkholderiaceae bacterium]|nr:hypothetical protein [Burkholderiaceae bacterium]